MVDNESQEMYLETILRLKKKKGSVRAIDIAEELGYSKPSVSRAVGIMKKDGFIVVHADGLIDLTETGKDKAENIFSRHKSLTQALVVMGAFARGSGRKRLPRGTRYHRRSVRGYQKIF